MYPNKILGNKQEVFISYALNSLSSPFFLCSLYISLSVSTFSLYHMIKYLDLDNEREREKIYVGVFLDKVRERKRKKKFSLHHVKKYVEYFRQNLQLLNLFSNHYFFGEDIYGCVWHLDKTNRESSMHRKLKKTAHVIWRYHDRLIGI